MQDRATEALRCAYGLIERSEKIAAIYPDGHLIHETASSIARAACRIVETIHLDEAKVKEIGPRERPALSIVPKYPVDDSSMDV